MIWIKNIKVVMLAGRLLQDYDAVMDKVAEAEELSADHRPSTLEKLAELASDTSAPKSSARSAPEL